MHSIQQGILHLHLHLHIRTKAVRSLIKYSYVCIYVVFKIGNNYITHDVTVIPT